MLLSFGPGTCFFQVKYFMVVFIVTKYKSTQVFHIAYYLTFFSEEVAIQHHTCVKFVTIILEIFALLIFACLIFIVIYYSRFQEATKEETSLQLSFHVFNFCDRITVVPFYTVCHI